MKRIWKALLPVAVLCASHALNAGAATEAERIAALEAQLNQQKAAMRQQQRMIEAMDAELQRLKAGRRPPRSCRPRPRTLAPNSPPAGGLWLGAGDSEREAKPAAKSADKPRPIFTASSWRTRFTISRRDSKLGRTPCVTTIPTRAALMAMTAISF